MTFAEQAERDLLNAISDTPLTFVSNEATYTDAATRGALITAERMLDGGILEEPDLVITTTRHKLNGAGDLKDRFAGDVPPAVGEVLTIDDVNYRIDRMHEDEFGVGIQYDLISPHRGGEGAGGRR